MAIDPEQAGPLGREPSLDHLLLAVDFVEEYPTLSSLVPGESAGTSGDMVQRIAGLYGEVELLLDTAVVGDAEVRWINFYLAETPDAPIEDKRGWLTIAVAGTKMPEGRIDYHRIFVHRSRWEVMLRRMELEA